MNTAKIKAYAPRARKDFIQAVTERANLLGISQGHIEPAEIKGDVAIIGGHAFPKKTAELRDEIIVRIKKSSFDQVIEAAAYTWFNRFAALHYMEIHDYLGHGYRVLSNRSGKNIPEILEHAVEIELPGLDRKQVIELKLAGNKDEELYRLLLIAQCNALHEAMPFLFGRIDDALELLMPANLLHISSPLRTLVSSIPEEEWENVEIIGWLYQFYISEKKDQVIGKVVKSEDIPAATQLFTPNWIVRYMVQNSLGRLWLSSHPDSRLKETMEYYIGPGEQPPEVLKELEESTPSFIDPEKITVLDPACGSGHILVEAYALLKEIYLERGYRKRDIPKFILTKNLFGLDIDDRAAQLAAFSLMMLARGDDRRFFSRGIRPNVFAIQESRGNEWDEVIEGILARSERAIVTDRVEQKGLFPSPVQKKLELKQKNESGVTAKDFEELIKLFKRGKTYGSLIRVPDELAEKLPSLRHKLMECLKEGSALSKEYAKRVMPFLEQAELLARKYDVVVANPPYMGSKGMNAELKKFAEQEYPDSKSDLFAMFIERNTELAAPKGQLGFMTPFVWMFISSYERLRQFLLDQKTITSLIQLEYSGFEGATVPICTFTIENAYLPKYKGGYVRLSDFKGAKIQGEKALEIIQAARRVGK